MKYIGLGKAFAQWCASTGVTEAAKASTAHHASHVKLMATKYLSDRYIEEVERAGVQRSIELEREVLMLRTTVSECGKLWSPDERQSGPHPAAPGHPGCKLSQTQ